MGDAMAKRARTTSDLAAIEERYRLLAGELAGIGLISAGSLTRRFTHCNRPGCKCQADPPQLHGPYWQWTAKVAGKTVTRRLSPEEAERYSEWIANDRELRRIITEMRKLAEQAAELTLVADREERAS
jgi:hypothetical protein